MTPQLDTYIIDCLIPFNLTELAHIPFCLNLNVVLWIIVNALPSLLNKLSWKPYIMFVYRRKSCWKHSALHNVSIMSQECSTECEFHH